MSKRKLINIFTSPRIQIPMIATVTIIGLLVCILNLYVGILIMDNISSIIVGENEAVRTQISHFVFLAVLSALVLNLFFVFVSAGLIISWGHRFLGAQYSLVRVIREQLMVKEYDRDIKVRSQDYLQDLAKALDDLRAQLKNINK